MGKQYNSEGLRLILNHKWLSSQYSDSFNYSNIEVQNQIIRDYILNSITYFRAFVSQIYIQRIGHKIIVRIVIYNDTFKHYKPILVKTKKKFKFRQKCIRSLFRKRMILRLKDMYGLRKRYFRLRNGLSTRVIFRLRNKRRFQQLFQKKKKSRVFGYSVRRLLSMNLTYLFKTHVILQSKNIIVRSNSSQLFNSFWPLVFQFRSPLSKFLKLKFISVVYHSLYFKSSLLLCQYLVFMVPRFCRKKRKQRRIYPFFNSLKSLINLLFLNNFCDRLDIKGIKIILKGRINGSRRKRTYLLNYGQTSVYSLRDSVSYYRDDCITIFGILGIKVWIIFKKKKLIS